MAFTIPAIADIGTRIRTAFRAYLPGTDAFIEPNNLSVAGKAFSLGLYEAYQRILYLYRQLFASTADGEHLEKRHAAEYGLTRKPSTGASGNVIIPQIVAGPQTAPVGLQVQRDDGVLYTVTTATAAFDGSFLLPVLCATTGAATNEPAGSTLTVVQQAAVPNLADTATVDSGGLGAAADAETDTALRARVLQRKQFTPMCGNDSDYERWALSVAGVTRAYASGFSNQPPGVVVYPLLDNIRENGFPIQSDLDAVTAYIDTVRPVTARLFVVTATPFQIDIELINVQVLTTANETAVATQLAALFAAKAAVSTVDAPLIFYRSWIEAAVDRALGGTGFTLAAPLGDIAVPIGALPFLGNIVNG